MKNLTVVSGEVSSIGVSKGGMDRTLFKNVILRDETGKSYKLYNVIAYEVPEEKAPAPVKEVSPEKLAALEKARNAKAAKAAKVIHTEAQPVVRKAVPADDSDALEFAQYLKFKAMLAAQKA